MVRYTSVASRFSSISNYCDYIVYILDILCFTILIVIRWIPTSSAETISFSNLLPLNTREMSVVLCTMRCTTHVLKSSILRLIIIVVYILRRSILLFANYIWYGHSSSHRLLVLQRVPVFILRTMKIKISFDTHRTVLLIFITVAELLIGLQKKKKINEMKIKDVDFWNWNRL